MTFSMDPENTPSDDISDLVESVRAVGERARFLAVNLAVVAAKIKRQGTSSARLNEDILDLVARITRVSQEVNDAVNAMEKGRHQGESTMSRVWINADEVGVPDERTLKRLELSLQETLELSRHIFRWIKEVHPEADVTPKRRRRSSPTMADDVNEAESDEV